ncbi:ribonuclease P protein component [Candidatus Gottesmanbacteria bacterium]|nr:ribonuclease P protein component [Candidatus Gottesmanbacteria bacterium]
MLPRKFRLNILEFYRNSQKSNKLKASFGTVFFRLVNKQPSRFAVVVPSALDKRTTCRHRTKRIIIEAVRSCIPDFIKNVEVLIKARKILAKQDRPEVEREVQTVFHKAEFI